MGSRNYGGESEGARAKVTPKVRGDGLTGEVLNMKKTSGTLSKEKPIRGERRPREFRVVIRTLAPIPRSRICRKKKRGEKKTDKLRASAAAIGTKVMLRDILINRPRLSERGNYETDVARRAAASEYFAKMQRPSFLRNTARSWARL